MEGPFRRRSGCSAFQMMPGMNVTFFIHNKSYPKLENNKSKYEPAEYAFRLRHNIPLFNVAMCHANPSYTDMHTYNSKIIELNLPFQVGLAHG